MHIIFFYLLRGEIYHLSDWNWNNFSDEFCKFLLGKDIPDDILELPRYVKMTSPGRMLLSFLNKDPISQAQGNTARNSNYTADRMHMIEESTAGGANNIRNKQ
ncbi:unnamed protein product [Didymodactylos carnosus]|uniref:PPPDE domain-containing protein n=1 Tax=Didymodactylos carnosus TaxID=1234261 RepID=A0A815G692_9BILA|nr:unnamed protein product [Didymodactylos carnosus]CAF1358958.1 unnamed protein product [Didymodactylos carnosus]CAF4169332.1 unnamed protein product [Didymodactylos carnosus]CAF4191484.1 unnamed protein product [Didymodactylos carnosus]